ncbi:hypothetical protein D7X94_08185 [Acutalibacter sp. 1XD8-33]|uniref:dockerin type I repeat-containing protein n=1 Tax=Acutalibacter sp. 1XD8-33 TaxID=2320081 RepID=UPI000EA0A5B5|nr:dockerin type I repeat-containing protein [Acutalibacter sp. 1XD8-33]RKJ40457.1 hypothetical protein D7X94_08185 [Acutalibacter sp. 1XD8-33]
MFSHTILKKPRWNRRRVKWKPAFAIVLILLFGMLMANADMDLPENFNVVTAENHTLVLLSESNGDIFLVLDDGEQWHVSCSNFSDGQNEGPVLKRIRPFEKVFQLNGEIGLAERIDGCVALAVMGPELDVGQAEQNGQTYFVELADDDLYTFTNDYLLCVGPGDGSALTIYGTMFDPDPPIETDITDVEFLSATQGGWIYAYSNGMLYRWKGRDYLSQDQIECSCPEKLIGENAFLDVDGTIHVVDGNTANVLFGDTEGLDTQKCYGTDDSIFVADTSGNVHKYDWDGNEVGISAISGEILAITGDCALVEVDGNLCVSTYQFVDSREPPESTPPEHEGPTPVPENTPEPDQTPLPQETPVPSPDPTPDPTPEPDTESSPTPIPPPKPGETLISYSEREGFEGNYALVYAGMHATDLRNLKSPQAIEIYDKTGKPIYDGLLKTGMKMDDRTIIVLGDCNGDGYVTSADIYFVQRCILGVETFETEESFMAADMHQDGKITTVDTIKIATEIKRR